MVFILPSVVVLQSYKLLISVLAVDISDYAAVISTICLAISVFLVPISFYKVTTFAYSCEIVVSAVEISA